MARRTVVLVCVGALAALAVVVPLGVRALSVGPELTGVADGATVNGERLRELGVVAPADADVEVLVDGQPVRTRRVGDRVVLADHRLSDGAHTVTARMSRTLLPDAEASRALTVDNTPPQLSVDAEPVENLRGPVTVRGSAHGARTLTADDREVRIDDAGRFTVTLPSAASVRLVARDVAGNETATDHVVAVRHPGMRAVHMTALGWTAASLREPVLRLAADGKIDTVQLDLKDESGEIGYRSQVPLAKQIGATRDHYDAKAVVDQLHAAGLRVVGRLVAFRDPILAQASWRSGATDRVLQTAAGTPWSGSYGEYAFTNFANPEVVDYNIALAAEAAALGFDDVLYDYVRRPEGALSEMRIPGLTGTPEAAIADFMASSRDAVREHGAFLGASVFGIAAQRPTAIGQDIRAIAEHVDYVAPMVYPSHWGPGEYGVDQPESQPYDITARSLAAFAEQVRGTDAQVIPWLQAFSLKKEYGPAEVRAQIKAAKDNEMPSFLLWNASCRYDAAGLQP